jgi:hypothetical protein
MLHAAHTLHMHTHTRSTDIIDHSIHESVMEIINLAHIYSGNVPGVLAYWRNIYNDFIGRMGMEQRQMGVPPYLQAYLQQGKLHGNNQTCSYLFK